MRSAGYKTYFFNSGYAQMLVSVIIVSFFLVDDSLGIQFLGVKETYAKYPVWNACTNASITFQFKTRQKDGLLMYASYHGRNKYLQVALTGGAVQLRIHFVREKEQNVEQILGSNMDDGKWHTIQVKRNRMETTLMVDKIQSSKVAFGLEFDESDTNNHVYFGGVPASAIQDSTLTASDDVNIPFRGEITNILYFNCSCIPVRASVLEGKGYNTEPKEACEVRNPCPSDCPCVSSEDGPGCECHYKKECIKDLLAKYQLPMDSLDGDLIYNPSGLDAIVYGDPKLVRGVHEMALQLDGRSQWIRVIGAGHKKECFGDLDHCPKGYFIGLWIQFQSASDRRTVYMSNGGQLSSGHGIAMSYSLNGLEFIFKTKDGRQWRVEEKNVLPGRWYHVAASWAADKGLFLFINGHQVAQNLSPSRTTESRDDGLHQEFIIGRPNDHTGLSQLGTILVDDFLFMSEFQSEKEMREQGPAFHYYLSMDDVQGNKLEAIGCDPRVFSQVQVVPGKIRQAVAFSGRGEYIDLGDVSDKCLGDLDACKHGLYISFFIRFSRLTPESGYIFSTPHGIDIYQMGSRLMVSAQKSRSVWEVEYDNLKSGSWYFIEVSWSQDSGVALYVDGQEVDSQVRDRSKEPRFTQEKNAFIGRSNEGGQTGRLTDAALDDLNIYYGTREMLANVGYLSTERPNSYHFDFEDIRGNRIVNDRMVITLTGSPGPTEGKVGQALQLDGNNEAADFGDHRSECFGNLDLCNLGALISLWLRPDKLRDGTYFLSSGDNGITLSYRGQKLYASARTSAKQWEVSTSNFTAGTWYFVEVSFHPIFGLGLYINNELVAEDVQPKARTDPLSRSSDTNKFYLGRGNVNMASARYAEATYDELEVWYADRDFLAAHGYIQRGRPQSFIIDFEELIDPERLMHPVLSIRLVGRPVLIPGKVNNALELRERGQYADLGRRGGECFSNLADCTHGITIAAWMRFRRFENNMVFLSTGENGILMMYKDGYIQVSADGRGVITVPIFETGRWYFVEITWHPDTGLKLFIDNEKRGESSKDEVGPPGQGSFYIGRPNQGDIATGRYSTGNFDIDEMEIWYDTRENLLAFGYINRDNLGYEAFSLDSADGRRIAHTKYIVLLINGASIVPGRFGNAIMLNGRGQYVDMGTHFDSCFGNIDQCVHGLTLSFWLNPRQLRDGQTFLSTPTYSIFYEDGELNSVFKGQRRSWTTSTSRIHQDEWQRITMAWHPKKGLAMYIDDELVDQDRQGVAGPARKKPASEHVYIGRSLDSDSDTANLLADELQVWYDDIDQLRATGEYKVQVVPQNVTFADFRDNVLQLRDRQIRGYGDIQLVQGKGEKMRALYLLGTSGYLDLGANFTCAGDLATCIQGATLRLGLKPRTLQDDVVFFDSYPMKLYYKNGRLHGQLQTATQMWTVETPDFTPGQWQRVELTWHPRDGLVMYIDGRRVDYQTYPVQQTSKVPADWGTYFGRALQGGKTYANTAVDSIEFWPAYKDYLSEDGYMNIEPYVATQRPVVTADPNSGKVTPQYTPRNTEKPQTEQVKIIHFSGASYVQFNLQSLPSEYLQPAEIEEFKFYFLSSMPDGLIWLHDDRSRKMYLAMKNGQLVFVHDDGTRYPDKIVIGQRDAARFDDGRWHLFKISRRGRRITLNVDERHTETYSFDKDVQFLAGGEVFLGGTQDSYASSGDLAVPNFNGGLAQVLYKTETKHGDRLFSNEVNLITELGESTGVIFQTTEWPIGPQTRPTYVPPTDPTPRLTSVTIKGEGVYLTVPERFQLQTGSSVSFRFQTIKRNALLMFAGSTTPEKNFIALEIYDGKFYLIYNFGGQSRRLLISETEVSDGQPHEVELRFPKDLVALYLDGQSKTMRLEAGEALPRNLGPLHFGGYSAMGSLPWYTWARNGYQGCLEDIRVNGRIVDLHNFWQTQQYGSVDQQCTAMPQQCSLQTPCISGYCLNKWGGYYCDCRATDFAGDQCQNPAWTGVFNGSTSYKMVFRPQQKYHVDDISFRFQTMVRDGIIFQTKARNDRGFMRAELEAGRMKITTNLGGRDQTFYTGNNLNDMQWHTVYMQRRGNQMAVWVDDLEQEKAILPGDGYYLLVDDVFVGGYRPGEVDHPAYTKHFTGYLRNFHIGDVDILQQIGATGGGVLYQAPNIPNLIFNDVTFPNYDAHAVLPALGSASNLNVYFMFKTNDPNGVILFSEGRNKELFAVELFQGKLHLKFDIPGRPPVHMATPENLRFNDGEWHAVFILHQKVNGQEQLSMAVDGLRSSYSYSGIDQLNLQGPLYVGGLPEAVFQKPVVREFLSSKAGYRGCLASIGLGRDVLNLFDYGQGTGILKACQDIRSQCTKLTCKNGGICHDHLNNGTTWCDCAKTAFTGPACEDEPLGYYFRNEGSPDLYGMMVYSYPVQEINNNEVDEIVLGVMTDEKNAVLTKLTSYAFSDFVEIKLVDGFPVVTYDTNGKGASTTITSDVFVSNGRYHIIKFLRTREKGTLTVDGGVTTNTHSAPHGVFDRLSKIFIGGIYQGGKIADGTGYRGIIGGLYVNGELIFPQAKKNVNTDIYFDVVEAPHPYKLGFLKPPASTPKWIVITTRSPVVTMLPPIAGIPILPSDIGGGGIAWEGVGGAGGDSSGVSVWVFPDGTAGSSGVIPAPLPASSGPVAKAQVLAIPPMPVSGPRAGAVMGTILGLAVLASSLTWAFVRCKPGWCTCLKPPAEAPLTISAPRAGTNIAAVTAASGAKPGVGGGLDMVDASAAGGGAKVTLLNSGAGSGINSAYFYSPQQSSSAHQMADSFDSSTLRATGTFSNKGTAIGTPRTGRHQFSSTSASAFESSASALGTPASLQSYHFEGGHADADYDVATGVHPSYQSNTLAVGGGGYSTSTMSSSYNYSVKTIRTVGGHFVAGGAPNVIVTPGPMGEEIRVDCCLMTGDGHAVVTGSSLGPPQVWTMSNGELLRIMQGETVGSTNLHLVCNDRLLVGAVNSDLEINQYSVPKGVHNYMFQIWDFASGRPLGMTNNETCSALTVMSDNDKVVFGRTDKFGGGTNIVVWDLLGNQPIKEMRYDAPVGNNDYINYISLSQNDRYVVAGFTNTFDNFAEFVIFDMTLTSYSIADPNILRLDANPDCTAILPKDEAVTGLRNGDLVIWSLRTGQPSRQLMSNNGKHAHSREVKAVARSEDNKFLVSASADGTLKLWDLESERNICTMSGHSDEVWCATISSDNEIVVSGSRDGTIRLWQLRNGREICSFNAGVDIFYITMSHDKETIVALGDKFGARKLIMLQVVRSKVKRQVPV